MGRKGANKRKPKANSWPVSKTNSNNSATDLVKGKEAPLSQGNSNSFTESNKTQKKH